MKQMILVIIISGTIKAQPNITKTTNERNLLNTQYKFQMSGISDD